MVRRYADSCAVHESASAWPLPPAVDNVAVFYEACR
jgi:hypothetical protein